MTGACVLYVLYVLVHCLAFEAIIYALRHGEGRKKERKKEMAERVDGRS